MGKEKVSVVVPVYNAEKTIELCVSSLLNVDYPKNQLELIFVDNKSTDSTKKILQRYQDRIILTSEVKKGPAAARNRGIKIATGDIIAFTDADCAVDKDWLKNMVNYFDRNKVGIIAGKILPLNPVNKLEEYICSLHNHMRSVQAKMPYAITINWASKKSVLLEAGLFDENFLRSQDTELSFRISRKGYELIYVPEAIVYHKDIYTYHGLFRKGYLSGFWNIKYYKKHQKVHKSLGLKKFSTDVLVKMCANLTKLFLKNGNEFVKYDLVYNMGRLTGKLIGSLRFMYLDF